MPKVQSIDSDRLFIKLKPLALIKHLAFLRYVCGILLLRQEMCTINNIRRLEKAYGMKLIILIQSIHSFQQCYYTVCFSVNLQIMSNVYFLLMAH